MQAHKILIADDSLTIQKVIRLALSGENFEIQCVADGNKVIEEISLFKPHVVLIDLSLPNKSAFEIKTAANKSPDLKETKFVLMSSAFEDIQESEVKKYNFDERLVKPFDPSHLRDVLNAVLEPFENLKSNKKNKTESFAFEKIKNDSPNFDFNSEDDLSILNYNETSNRPTTTPDEPESSWSIDEPSLKPPENFFEDKNSFTGNALNLEDDELVELEKSLTATEPSTEPDLERIIGEQVQKFLKETVQEKIPDLAEKIIREEINKLLNSNSP